MQSTVQTKVCTKCGVEKAVSEFYRKANRPLWRTSECKACMDTRRKKWNVDNPERQRERMANYHKEYSKRPGYKKIKRDYSKRARKKIIPSYARWLLTQRTELHASDIPEGFMEIFRAKLKLTRNLRKHANETK